MGRGVQMFKWGYWQEFESKLLQQLDILQCIIKCKLNKYVKCRKKVSMCMRKEIYLCLKNKKIKWLFLKGWKP